MPPGMYRMEATGSSGEEEEEGEEEEKGEGREEDGLDGWDGSTGGAGEAVEERRVAAVVPVRESSMATSLCADRGERMEGGGVRGRWTGDGNGVVEGLGTHLAIVVIRHCRRRHGSGRQQTRRSTEQR